MAELIFLTSVAFILYVYVGYPLLLVLWRRLAGKPVKKGYWEPAVSIVIAARNESDHIEAKLQNCLQLDYPKQKLQFIVALDAPTDGTAEIAGRYASSGFIVVRLPRHAGKAVAINRAVAQASGDFIVFTDARQSLDKRSIRELVAPFKDPSVGVVSGELVIRAESGGEWSEGAGFYWRYEKAIRKLESDIYSTCGATGAIYAIRRESFHDLPPRTILDDVLLPVRIVLSGKRAVFEPAARAFDRPCDSFGAEFQRKVRTLYGNYQFLRQMPEVLLPWRNPIFIQYMSHKVARLAAPYALLGLFVSNVFLLRGVYLALFVLQVTWYLLAGVGLFVDQSQPSLVTRESQATESKCA